jgi:hypothetical protein
MDEVQQKEQELELAKLAAQYDEAVERFRGSGSDEDKDAKDALADQVVAKRQELRQARESDAAAMSNGANPAPVEAPTEVN